MMRLGEHVQLGGVVVDPALEVASRCPPEEGMAMARPITVADSAKATPLVKTTGSGSPVSGEICEKTCRSPVTVPERPDQRRRHAID